MNVLDLTFSEQFGQPVNDIPEPPRNDVRPRNLIGREQQQLHHTEARPRAPRKKSTCGRPEPRANTDNGTHERQSIRQQQPVDPPQVHSQPSPAPILASDVPRCDQHGLICVEREVSRDGPNKGRMFYVCPLPQAEKCDFFSWVSDSNTSLNCPGHGEPCAERTVKKEGPNKGRQFYTCRRSQTDSCGFFHWKDEVMGTHGGVPPASRRSTGTSNAPKCSGHNNPCVLRTTRKPGPNQNREFYSCSSQGPDSCGYFEWKDEKESQPRRQKASSLCPSGNREGENDTLVCDCGLPGILLTCKNGANAGRTFYKCPNPQGNQCDFFEWGS